MKLDEDPSEQQEQLRRKRRSRKNKEQHGAARADSEEWDEMAEAGWSVKDSSSLLVGAGYVLAPWRKNQNIRQLKHLTEGKDTGFWV